MQPFVLRRLKKDVLKDLPKKTEELIYCDMIPKQKSRYTNLISTFTKRAETKVFQFNLNTIKNLD